MPLRCSSHRARYWVVAGAGLGRWSCEAQMIISHSYFLLSSAQQASPARHRGNLANSVFYGNCPHILIHFIRTSIISAADKSNLCSAVVGGPPPAILPSLLWRQVENYRNHYFVHFLMFSHYFGATYCWPRTKWSTNSWRPHIFAAGSPLGPLSTTVTHRACHRMSVIRHSDFYLHFGSSHITWKPRFIKQEDCILNTF